MNKPKLPRPHLIAAAESFARISCFADLCYRYYLYDDLSQRPRLERLALKELSSHLESIPEKYHQRIIATALTELTYPCPSNDPNQYPFSERERATCSGISRQTWRTHGMNDACKDIIDHIIAIAHSVRIKVKSQIF
ncbi:hypothetical protein AO364_1210 [Moraxella catarrhalis]|uniref:hypothetical protein n=1 Tax=Moraxella catarrhalis TaxID=480 RepID=UPI0007E75992|nr:hypothetical protein [Moraxella catarrhalis]OAV36042.1 hypothetical protein AO364_1210 [Moraxella catarrhalis]